MKRFPTLTVFAVACCLAHGAYASPPAPAGPPAKRDVTDLHAGMVKPVEVGDVRVPKAAGPDARTVGEVMSRPADLKDKPVTIRGRIVKFTPGILGKNWIHLRDGTGLAADNTHDLVVTTTDEAHKGDVVIVKGVVRTDRDLGAGYFYRVLVEDAKLAR